MSGTKAGGKKVAAKLKAKYGDDFYKRIAAKGGRASNTGGFYHDRERAIAMGKLGGRPAQVKKAAHKAAVSKVRRDQALKRIADGRVAIDPVTRLLVSTKKSADVTQTV